MSRKHAELEREFLADLEPRTGRSLADWMAAIDGAGLSERNAIIDWLRPQGLTFAHASWLERIHNNGGRAIYGAAAEGGGAPGWGALAGPVRPLGAATSGSIPAAPRAAQPIAPAAQTKPETAPDTTPVLADPSGRENSDPQQPRSSAARLPSFSSAKAPPPTPAGAASGPTLPLADLLGRGKGLRPLAEMLLRELHQALPGLEAVPVGDLVSLRRPSELGVLVIGPRELKLGLDLGLLPVVPPLVRARIPGASEAITHMLLLSDARQVDAVLIGQVAAADLNANRLR